MKHLLIILAFFATTPQQPLLAEESADTTDATAPTTQSTGTVDADKGEDKANKQAATKNAGGEAEPDCE